MKESLLILGSTGSVGRQALDVVRALDLSIVGLSAHENLDLLFQQFLEFRPPFIHLSRRENAERFKQMLEQELSKGKVEKIAPPMVFSGEAGLQDLFHQAYDCVLIAISGFAALPALAMAIEAGQRIALANKEAIVCAGHLFMPEIKRLGIELIPVDSEHSAIWQCLKAAGDNPIERIYLTASGGPFRNYSRDDLAQVTVKEALRHPRWKMGAKITLDSATLMNKGLELIEAERLFGLDLDKIEVLVHPEALFHSMIAFSDASVIAQAAVPDMRLPIQLAFTWPQRVPGLLALPDFTGPEFSKLSFEKVDEDVFPALKLARRSFELGDLGPSIYNASNELAAEHFLAGKISLIDIYKTVEWVIEQSPAYLSALHLSDGVESGIHAIMKSDAWARAKALEFLSSLKSK